MSQTSHIKVNVWWLRLSWLDISVLVISLILCVFIGLLQFISRVTTNPDGYILYLAPSNAPIANIWMVNGADFSNPVQMTHSETGVQSFVVSPNGRWVVYAEYQAGTRDTYLILLNTQTGQAQPLTACEDSSCENPVFSPDSRYVAYERISLNTRLPGVPATSFQRVWIVDIYSEGRAERPLELDDYQKLGRMVNWSPDGQHMAVFDRAAGGVRLYDLNTDSSTFISESYGDSGAFTPDAKSLIFPILQDVQNGQPQTALRRFYLDNHQVGTVQMDISDLRLVALAYSPDGKHLAGLHLSQQASCDSGPALYLARVLDQDTIQTISHADYCVSHIVWHPTGDYLFLQRVMLNDDDPAHVEVWQYTLAEHSTRRVIADGYHLRWLPARQFYGF